MSEKAGKDEANRRKGETYEKKDKNLNHVVKIKKKPGMSASKKIKK